MQDIKHEEQTIDSATYGDLFSKMESTRKEREKDAMRESIEKREKLFNQRLEQLADRAIEYSDGMHDPNMAMLLESFLDVALQLKGVMETMHSINLAMDCITDAISFLDQTFVFDQLLMDESLSYNYGFMSRMKARIKMKKTIRNNAGRILALADSLCMKYQLVNDMAQTFGKVGKKLNSRLNRRTKRMNTQKKKTGGNSSAALSPAQQYMAARMAASGKTSSASASASSGGIDDIL